MNDEMQALCFIAGANSIFYGEKLLTTDNPEADKDQALFQRLGITPEAPSLCAEISSADHDHAAHGHQDKRHTANA
jgi:biotin synthase